MMLAPRPRLALAGLLVMLGACAPAQAPPPAAAVAPAWQVGDRWRHAWTAGAERGLKTSEVVSLREVNGVRFYVVRVEGLDRYYTTDLHWAANVVESRVAARAQPPQPWFMWPLEVGRHWDYTGVYEEPERKEPLSESYSVLGVEQVGVPAGMFWAFKLARQGRREGLDQYWYSPEVRWYVKWLGHRGRDEFEEVLQEYAPATPMTPPAPPAVRPDAGKE